MKTARALLPGRRDNSPCFRLVTFGLIYLAALLFMLSSASAAFAVGITLEWGLSIGPDLAGYRVFYRAEGEDYNYNTPGWEGTERTCTIYGLADNTAYCFVARAFDSSYNETSNSNEVCYQPAGSLPLTADAGIDQMVGEGAKARLDGSGSFDPSGDPLTFQWTQTAGISVQLSDPTIVDPIFTAPTGITRDEVLTFQLVVSDGQQSSAPDTVNVTVQEGPTASFTASPTSTESPLSVSFDASGSSGPLWFEAEDGYVSAPMEVAWADEASSAQYIWVPRGYGDFAEISPGAGYAEYTFEVPVSGTYVVWGRVVSNNTADDSFFVSIDGGPYACWWTQLGGEENWVWDQVNNVLDGSDPVLFSLEAGQHTLTIKQREDGTKIDKILITKDLEYIPEGLGPAENGTIVSYFWDFGDGATDWGVNTSHTFASAGTYTVTLTVTDDQGATDTATTTITVTATQS